MRTRTWYAKYIGYCFNDKDGREAVLTDIFYFEDEGKITGTGYEVHYPDTDKYITMDLGSFRKNIVQYTNLPR